MTTPQNTSSTSFLKILFPVLVLILLVLGALSLIKSEVGRPRDPVPSINIEPGNNLPDFKLTQMDGKLIPLSSVIQSKKAKLILINFWASWCEACMEEMPSLVELRKAHHREGFEIIGINLDDDPNAVVPGILKRFGIEFLVYKDPDNSVADLFDVHAIPMTVVLNQNRKILYHKDGDKNWNSPEVHSDVKRWLAE